MSSLEITYVNNDSYVTAANAARYLNVSRSRISKLIETGRFDVLEIGSSRLIPAHEILAYEQGNRKPGRRKKMQFEQN